MKVLEKNVGKTLFRKGFSHDFKFFLINRRAIPVLQFASFTFIPARNAGKITGNAGNVIYIFTLYSLAKKSVKELLLKDPGVKWVQVEKTFIENKNTLCFFTSTIMILIGIFISSRLC